MKKAKAAPKKRKVRSQEDKILENAPMNTPFFVETGSNWHATDIGTFLAYILIYGALFLEYGDLMNYGILSLTN